MHPRFLIALLPGAHSNVTANHRLCCSVRISVRTARTFRDCEKPAKVPTTRQPRIRLTPAVKTLWYDGLLQLRVLRFGLLEDGDVGRHLSIEENNHCGSPIRRSRSAKRGSECRLSKNGSTLTNGIPEDRSS